jgi:hypothetical protein
VTHTHSRTSLDEGWARHKDLYPTTHNQHKGQALMPLEGFEPTIPASKWTHTHVFDHVVTEIGWKRVLMNQNFNIYALVTCYFTCHGQQRSGFVEKCKIQISLSLLYIHRCNSYPAYWRLAY